MYCARIEKSMLVAILGILLWAGLARAQTPGNTEPSQANPPGPPPSAMEMTITSIPPVGADGKIYVNQNCAILPDLNQALNANQKVDFRYDPVICHIESAANSGHREEKAVGDELERSRVDVHEQQFVLENITMKPVIFNVLVRVPKGWVVDSDPQPKEMRDDVAIFEAHASAGEIVRLHVGVRHTKDLKPKALPSTGGP